ncbi:RNA polymerase sigma factor [Aureivirga marina]|uniref:RNA polymerase sigma factor n=1 Tax=Aureivirga marina TaxID=1182451 RepID=UPI0018C9F096|nr:sigma-70 family RNA polymerase sigma factor [Aureivirga marina]
MAHPKKLNFEEILLENKTQIYRICKIYAKSPLEPKDLFQETVYELWKSFNSFQGKSDIKTWIYRITLNICIRSKEKSDRKNHLISSLDSIQITPADAPIDHEKQEKYDALLSCISKLEESNKQITILYLEKLPYKEIAKITGISENHVAVKMKRIRKILLECITKKLD